MPKIPRSEPWQHRFVEAYSLRFHVVTAGPAGFDVAARDLRGYNESDTQEAAGARL
jgi:predicted alpha/beta hydrolase